MTHLDEKAVEAAWDTLPQGSTLISRKAFRCAIRAYLTSLPSSPVSELVDVTMDRIVQECVSEKLFLGTVNARAVIRKHIASTLSTHNAELEREVKRLREALERIDGLEVVEINPSNYSHEDVCELNNNAIQAALIANAALYRPALSTSPQGGEHA